MASLVEKGDIVTLEPKDGFVVKTKIIDATNLEKYDISTKVFINICHDSQVPQPKQEFDPQVVFPLIINNLWEIPIITSCEKESKDKKGQPSLVYDCCINSVCFRWCQVNADLRSILIEWCLEAVEMMYDVILEREYTIPKMLSKGELTNTEILKSELEGSVEKKLEHIADERMGLIEDLREKENEGIAEDLEALPDIMNVGGNKRSKGVLIEEVDDVEMEEKRKRAASNKIQVVTDVDAKDDMDLDLDLVAAATANDEEIGLKELKTMKISPTEETLFHMEIDNSVTERRIHENISEMGWHLEYIPTFVSLPNGKMCVKLVFPTLTKTPDFAIKYYSLLECVKVSSGSSSLAINTGKVSPEIRSFWIQDEKALYVFTK